MLKETIRGVGVAIKDKPALEEDRQTYSSLTAFMPNNASVKIRRGKKNICFFKAEPDSQRFRSTSLFSTAEVIACIVQVLPSHKG